MAGSILSYHQADSIKLLCEIDFKNLLPAPKERDRFDKSWNDFLKSDSCNKEIFKRKGDRLIYQSEQLIPSKSGEINGLFKRHTKHPLTLSGSGEKDTC